MRIYQLEGFYYVGKTGGYAAAARAIPYPVGQPAIHQQVKKLQDELDVPLVRRDGKRILLTPEGRLLHDFVTPFFEGLTVLDRRLRTGREGSVVIAATDIFTDHFLPGRLRRIRAAMPGVSMSVREVEGIQHVLDAVGNGAADFGITHFPKIPPRFHHAPAGTVEVMVAVPDRHPLAKKREVTLAEIAKHPLVAYEKGSFSRAIMDATFEKARLKADVAVEASTSSLQIRYVMEGLGIGLIPRMVGADRRDSGLTFVPTAAAFGAYAFHVVWIGGSFPSKVLQQVKDLLVAEK